MWLYLFTSPGNNTIVTEGTDSAALDHLFVNTNFLQRGLGTKLLHHAMSHCQTLRIRKILVLSDSNAAFRSFRSIFPLHRDQS
ncbi:MAG TPA: GNAT family N-acetyltransferase [Fuerstia sp.]|nr:GNAT family N-acetyltransferase [Fuerstiella sp.]